MENAFERGSNQAGLAEHILFMSSQLGRSIGVSLAPFIRNSVLQNMPAGGQPFVHAQHVATWCWFGTLLIALALTVWGFWSAGGLTALRSAQKSNHS
jgi:hypothetical protein